MTLKQLLDLWMNEKQLYKLKHRTFVRYSDIIRTQINPALGHISLTELTLSDIKGCQRQKLIDGNTVTGKPLANNTVKNMSSILRNALIYGKDERKLEMGVDPYEIPLIHFEETPVEAFRKDEQRLIEKVVLNSSKPNHFGIVLCLYTGLRLGELLALTWDDIDFTACTLSVDKTSAYYKDVDGVYKIFVTRPKTESSVRIIPVPKPIVQQLKQLRKRSTSEYVISTRNGGMVTTRSYQTTFTCLLAKAKVKYRNFHVLRHTFATRALECGMDVKTLSEIMGHKSPVVTMNRYAHSLMETKQKMMNLLAKALDFGKQKTHTV